MEYKFNDNEVRQQFLDFMQANDCEPIEDLYIQLDGKIHRYKVRGDKSGDKSGAYCIFSDHWPAGWVQNWRNGAAISWCYERDRLNDEGKSYFTDEKYKKALSISRKHQDKLKREREAACIKASETVRIFTETLPNATNDFPYLVKKSVFAIGYLKFNPASKQLCLPLTDIEGNVKSMQYIDAEGNKKFHPGTSTTGVFFGYQLDRLDKEPDLPILITEGYATLATVASRLDFPCVAAMTCHNLLPVAADLKKKYPGHKIIIMADNDHMTKGNPGLTKAREAEAKLGLQGIAYPKFEEGEDGSDWNDLYRLRGFKNAADELNKAFVWAKKTQKERDEIEAEKKANNELLPLLDSLDPSVQLQPQEFVGGIFPRKFVSIVAAAPGTGKTMLMQRLVSDLSLGGSILDGVAEDEPVRKCLIFAGEAGWELLVPSLKWPINPQNVKVADQYKLESNNKTVMLDDEDGWDNVRRIINNVKPDIVFWDTFSSFHEKDENKATEIKPLIRNVANLARDNNFAAVLNHHSRKRLTKERNLALTQDDVIGSSIFNRLAALIIGIEKDEDELDGTGKVLKVRALKTWFGAFKSFNFTLEEGFWGGTVMNIDTNPKDVSNSRNSVWNYLVTTFKPGEWFTLSEIDIDAIKPKIGERQLRNILTGLYQEGDLNKDGSTRGAKYSRVH